ncbi:MAG: hypothetical protein ACOH1Y_17505, partial [Propionicimonas sp.]
MTPPEHQNSQDDLMRIVADIGRVNAHNGLEPGTGAFRLELTPLQLTRLAQELSADAIQALGLALHFGKIYTDPIRVEILGWSRKWLIEQGMRHGPAQRAAAELGLKGFLSTTTSGKVGERGPRKLAILKGERFGWDDKPTVDSRATSSVLVNPQVSPSERFPSRHSDDAVDNPAGAVNPQVNPSERKPLRRSDTPVDNETLSSEREPLRRGTSVDNLDGSTGRKPLRREVPSATRTPSEPTKAQASTLEWILSGRTDAPTTTSSKEEKESLSFSTWSDGTLTRTAMDQFLLS